MTVKNVFQAVSDVMNDVREVRKTGRNNSQNFNFRGIDAVMNAVGPKLRSHGVIVVPIHSDLTAVEVHAGSKKAKDTSGNVTYRWYGPDGSYFDSQVFAEGRDYADKGAAKTMSVALRTCILQTLCLPTDDPDPDEDYIESGAVGAVAAGLGAKPVPEVDRVKQEIVRIMGEDKIPPADILSMYHEGGGTSQTFADAQDLPPLKIVLEALGGS